METLSPRVNDWLNERCESDKSRSSYISGWKALEEFCSLRGKDVNKLVDDYTKGQATYTELVKKAKENEILDKQKRLQEFEQNATQTLQKRNTELLQPIYEKIIKTIETVATQNGFTYILDVSKGSIVFTSQDSQNIDPLVLALLK